MATYKVPSGHEGISPDRRYFTVVVRESKSVPWEIHFGDYDKACAQDERDDVIYSGYAKFAKIVRTGDTQGEINLAVKRLNAEFQSPSAKFLNYSDTQLRSHIADYEKCGNDMSDARAELDRRINRS